MLKSLYYSSNSLNTVFLETKSHRAGGFGRFHKNIAARPPFWRQSLAPNCQSLAPNCQTLEQKSGVFSAHSRFSPSLFCAALGFAGWPKKVWRQSLFARPWRARPFPAHTRRHRRAPKPSTIPHERFTRTVLCRGASVLRPPLLHSAPKSGAKSGA